MRFPCSDDTGGWQDYCTNMFQCFVSYIFMVTRGDGLKDVQQTATMEFSHNIADFAQEP